MPKERLIEPLDIPFEEGARRLSRSTIGTHREKPDKVKQGQARQPDSPTARQPDEGSPEA